MRAVNEDLQRVPATLLGFVYELAREVAQQRAHAQSPHFLCVVYCMRSVKPLVYALRGEHLTPCEPFVYDSFLLCSGPAYENTESDRKQIHPYNEVNDSWILELRRYGNTMGIRGSYLAFR